MPTRDQNEQAGNLTTRLLRKNPHTFRVGFFEDDDLLVPCVSSDASSYPEYTIKDVNNLAVAAGLLVASAPVGYWIVEWTPAADATLTTDTNKYRFEAMMESDTGREIVYFEEFDLADFDITATERDRAMTYLAMPGTIDERIYLRLDYEPAEVALQVVRGSTPSSVNTIVEESGIPPINYVNEEDTHIYYYDVPSNDLTESDYQVVWTVREKVYSANEQYLQLIRVPGRKYFNYLPSMRMFIDKLQKRLGQIQAYGDSDIIEYLYRGKQIVDGWHPNNYTWDINNFPAPLEPFLLVAASLWGLSAQALLETELAFSFSGQTVTLDYDHSGGLDSAISRMTEFLTRQPGGLSDTKIGFMRRATPVGVMAGRPLKYAGRHSFVYRTDAMNSSNFINLLASFGLL